MSAMIDPKATDNRYSDASWLRLRRLYEYAKEVMGSRHGPRLFDAIRPLAEAGIDAEERWRAYWPDDENDRVGGIIVVGCACANPTPTRLQKLRTESLPRFTYRLDGVDDERTWELTERAWAKAEADAAVADLCRKHGVAISCDEAKAFTAVLMAAVDRAIVD